MSIEAKKLAIIKSNAAPEVKLKALEKLNSVKNNGQSEVSAAIKSQLKMRAEDLKSGSKEMINYCDQLIANASGSRTGWDQKDYEIILKSLAKAKNLLNSALTAAGA